MKTFFSRMNPTARGFLIILGIVVLVVAFQLQCEPLRALVVAQIAFLIAIVFVIYRMWRERREEIAALAVARAGRLLRRGDRRGGRPRRSTGTAGRPGSRSLAFVGVLVLCGFAMWRTWRDQHHFA